jgi:predicted HicB family RNase H-like nuclease
MAIPRKPVEQAIQSFIREAQKPADNPWATTIRFKPEQIVRIDAAAARMGISRNSWVKYAISRTLDIDGF